MKTWANVSYVVDAYKLLVLFQCFLLGIEVINLFWGIILEMLVVDDAAQRETVAQAGCSAGQPMVNVATGITSLGSFRVSMIIFGI